MHKSEKELMERAIKYKIEKRVWVTTNLPKRYVELLKEIEYIKNVDINPYDFVNKSLYDFYYSYYNLNYDDFLSIYDKFYINSISTIKLHVNPKIRELVMVRDLLLDTMLMAKGNREGDFSKFLI